MSNWMRRRIERSRARCEKAAAGQRADKAAPQSATSQPGQQAQADQGESS